MYFTPPPPPPIPPITTSSTISTTTQGSSSVSTYIQTTVNGSTTIVTSNEPGTIQVHKTDTTQSISSDVPVTVTENPPVPAGQSPLGGATPTIKLKKLISPAHNNPFVSLLRNLWDRMKKLIWFDRLTQK